MSFNQDSAISSLNGKPLKLVDQFLLLGSNISSTESYIICIGKAWTAIEKLTTTNLIIKWVFFKVLGVLVLLYGCTPWT